MNGGKILIIDDDAPHRAFLRAALEREGHRVLEAADGVDGLRAVHESRPDLVLLDLDMPRLDGFGVCRRIRADRETRLLPVLMVTALDALPEKLRALECGVDEFLNKPVNLVELLTRVRALLRLRGQVLELENAALVLEVVSRTVERRDVHTAEHSGRVRDYAERLGRALELPEEDLDTLRLGAALHDVGKIGIPDAVLLKAGPLTPEEYGIIKRHPVIGAELCRPLRSLARALPLIRHHHERLDGSGYPDGLGGAEIPLLVRILSVADVFDALTSPRRYRPELTRARALEILDAETARGWWDARVVGILKERVLPLATEVTS